MGAWVHMPRRSYDTIIDFDDERLRQFVERGRSTLAYNDVLMRASMGEDTSLFRDGNRQEAAEVAMVNLCYAIALNDWSFAGIAVAALELALAPADDESGEAGESGRA